MIQALGKQVLILWRLVFAGLYCYIGLHSSRLGTIVLLTLCMKRTLQKLY